MKYARWMLLLGCAALVAGPAWSVAKADGVVIQFGDLKSKTPADWKEEEVPENAQRLGRMHQFKLPKKGEDKDDAELFVFYCFRISVG